MKINITNVEFSITVNGFKLSISKPLNISVPADKPESQPSLNPNRILRLNKFNV